MKKIFMFVVLIGIMFLHCGQDGKDGLAFLRFTWDEFFQDDSYADDNPSFPAVIWELQYYETGPGEYNFTYESCDEQYCYTLEGTYTITINPGEEASLFVDGQDGADEYYTLYLLIDGIELEKPVIQKKTQENNRSIKRAEWRSERSEAIGMTHVKTLRKGNTTLRVEYRFVAKNAKV